MKQPLLAILAVLFVFFSGATAYGFCSDSEELLADFVGYRGFLNLCDDDLYHSLGFKAFDASFGEWYHRNGTRAYSDFNGHWHYANGQQAFDHYRNNWFHKNGQIAFSNRSGNWYYPDGETAFQRKERKWYYTSGQLAYDVEKRKLYQKDGEPVEGKKKLSTTRVVQILQSARCSKKLSTFCLIALKP